MFLKFQKIKSHRGGGKSGNAVAVYQVKNFFYPRPLIPLLRLEPPEREPPELKEPPLEGVLLGVENVRLVCGVLCLCVRILEFELLRIFELFLTFGVVLYRGFEFLIVEFL